MKADINSKRYNEMLARYLGGEMSEAEMNAFEKEYTVPEADKINRESMKKQWTALKEYKDTPSPDARKAWDKLHVRLQQENLIPDRRVEAKSRLLPGLVKMAAVLLILLTITAIVFYRVTRKTAVEMVQMNTRNETNTIIKTLADGSVIYIDGNSMFSFPEKFEPESRKVELKGKAFFDITPDPGKPFIIETDEAQIEVLGTAFHVRTNDGSGFELLVERGTVKVTLKKDPSHSEMVFAGEKISALKNSLVKSQQTAGEDTSWYKQRMQFKDETLQNIIHVLNRNFNANFTLANQEIGKRRLTVTFHNETVETMTGLICATLNVKSQIINGSAVFSENNKGSKQQ